MKTDKMMIFKKAKEQTSVRFVVPGVFYLRSPVLPTSDTGMTELADVR